MSLAESLLKVLDGLPEGRQREVLDFAEFLSWQEERKEWQRFGKTHLARAYGPNEPDYSSTDLKSEPSA